MKCHKCGSSLACDDSCRLCEMLESQTPPGCGGNTSSCWPMRSDAMAVHPSQIPAVMERNKKHNVHVDYDPVDGRPILMDRSQRRDLMRIEGFADKEGTYGDTHASNSQAHDAEPALDLHPGI